MQVLYIIPARGGSKGIPHKNIKPFCGKPLILHAIDQARALAPDTMICLSTDDPQIRAVAEAHGLPVPFLRPAELSTDTAGSREVILHALDYWQAHGHRVDAIVLLQPTSPLRTVADIRGALDLYGDDTDMVVSVRQAATNPYYNAFEPDSQGYLHISKGPGTYTRRQDAPQVYEYNGAVYVIRPEALRRYPLGSLPRRRPYQMPSNRSIDLDTPTDWQIAEAIARSLSEKTKREC